jgi:hypothetical protein
MTESREEWADASPPQWLAQQPIERQDDQPETPPDVEEIAHEIETTRERMTSTVEAIGQRLDPANIAQGAKDVVREATVGKVEQKMQQVAGGVENAATTANQLLDEAGTTAHEATTNVVEMLRRNPVPAALIGIGIGMLWMNRDSGKSTNGGWASRAGNGNGYGYAGRSAGASRSGYGSGYGTARFDREANPYGGTSMHFESGGGHVGGAYGDATGAAGIGDRVADAVSGPASQAIDAARDVAGRAGEVAGSARDVAAEIPQRVGYAARDVADTVAVVPDQFSVIARQAIDRAAIMVEENPIGVAVAALAVGAAVGLALPPTRAEQQLLGPASETVIHRAGEALTAPLEQMQQQISENQQGSGTQQGSEFSGSQSQWSAGQGFQGR